MDSSTSLSSKRNIKSKPRKFSTGTNFYENLAATSQFAQSFQNKGGIGQHAQGSLRRGDNNSLSKRQVSRSQSKRTTRQKNKQNFLTQDISKYASNKGNGSNIFQHQNRLKSSNSPTRYVPFFGAETRGDTASIASINKNQALEAIKNGGVMERPQHSSSLQSQPKHAPQNQHLIDVLPVFGGEQSQSELIQKKQIPHFKVQSFTSGNFSPEGAKKDKVGFADNVQFQIKRENISSLPSLNNQLGANTPNKDQTNRPNASAIGQAVHRQDHPSVRSSMHQQLNQQARSEKIQARNQPSNLTPSAQTPLSPLKSNSKSNVYSILHNKRAKESGFDYQSRMHRPKSISRQHRQTPSASPSKITNQQLPQDEENKKQNVITEQRSQQKIIEYRRPDVKVGQGKYGPIELVIYKKELYALKKIAKTSVDKPKRIEHIMNEKNVLKMLQTEEKSPLVDFIVPLEATFIDHENINFMLEFLPGQDLFWVMQNEMNLFLGKKQSAAGYKEWVKFYAAEVLVAMEMLHKHKVIYRDLKPENVMIDKEGHIKLIDFGFAKKLSSKNKYRTFTNCGTMGYTAPELILNGNQGYSFAADLWSYGIFLAEMIQGSLPFDNQDDPYLVEQQIIKGEVKMPRDIEKAGRNLLQQILVVEPNLRIPFNEIKQHKYFQEIDWQQVEQRKLEPVPYKPNPLKYRYLLYNNYPTVTNMEVPEGSSQSPTRRKLLGDYTIYKVNKEFENF